MLEFIQLIKQRYQTVLQRLDANHPLRLEYQQCVEQLLYAEAFIRKGLLIQTYPKTPLQIAVIGPTQAGKSSVVNRLLNANLAGVSPLAGYTVHPHGYGHAINRLEYTGIFQYFGKFQEMPEAVLSRDALACYSISESQNSSSILPPALVWDTPDFDSIDASDYREGLIRTLALADIVVLVVSKEKYADQSVWQVMKTIAAFQQPTLICLNKLSPGSETDVITSLQQKWRQHRQDATPDIVPMLFLKSETPPLWPEDFNKALFKLAARVAHGKHQQHQQQWLRQYWQNWLAPIYAEHQAELQWRALVDACVVDGLKHYQRDYLNHPHHYDTFQQAILNLLQLLELPGIARISSKVRRVMTWPLKQLMRVGRDHSPQLSQETVVLRQVGEHVIIQLADRLWERQAATTGDNGYWLDAAAGLRGRKTLLLQAYHQAIEHYLQDFQLDVEAAAQRLYRRLQEQPLLLNSLRATRAAADTAAMLLALQAGGIGVHDIVLMPMMMSVTSLLAESAIGNYMARVEADLKLQQLQAVQARVFTACLQPMLYEAPKHNAAGNRFNIPLAVCEQADLKLNEKKHGLRFL